jgi:hypothetical protein
LFHSFIKKDKKKKKTCFYENRGTICEGYLKFWMYFMELLDLNDKYFSLYILLKFSAFFGFWVLIGILVGCLVNLGFGFDGLCLSLLEGNVCGSSFWLESWNFCCAKAALFFTLFVVQRLFLLGCFVLYMNQDQVKWLVFQVPSCLCELDFMYYLIWIDELSY